MVRNIVNQYHHLQSSYLQLPFVKHVYYQPAGKRLLKGEYWNTGILKNMPKHYKNFYKTWSKGPQTHIHSHPNPANFEKDEWGEIFPVQNCRIHVLYPEEFHSGLWGGEGVIKGIQANKETRHRSFKIPHGKYWWPTLFEGVVYSEILDRYIEMVMTMRGARVVDDAKGFDNYLLSTPVNEVYAWRLLKLKREILLALTDEENFASKYHKHGPGIFDKYQPFAVSESQADWHGLTMNEAKTKQRYIEEKIEEESIVPDKIKYREELFALLKGGDLDDVDFELLDDAGDKKSGGVLGVLGEMKNVFGGKK